MHRPGLPGTFVPDQLPERSAGARAAHAGDAPLWLEYGPRMLSVGSTSWLASGVTLAWSSFFPILAQLRPAKDISNSLRAGPVANEARLANLMSWRVAVRSPV